MEKLQRLSSFIITGCFIVLITFIHYSNRENIQNTFVQKIPAYSEIKVRNDPERLTKSNDGISFRNDFLRTMCEKGLQSQYNFTFSRNVQRFYVSKNANVTYCKVPKAGSSLISTLFLMMVGRPASHVHAASIGVFGKAWPLPEKTTPTFKFMVARDPYSRLYSAYIDKYFLLEHRDTLKTIQKMKNKGYYMTDGEHCGYDITFQDFLDYSLDIALNTDKDINRHWSPLYLLCRPCDIDYHVIAKQETLSRDLSYIMEHMSISTEMRDLFNKTIRRDSTCERISNLYKTRFSKLKDCQSMKAYAYRIWESFKIQGIIRADLRFPFSDTNSLQEFNQDIFCEAVQKYRKDYPLSKEAKTRQRHNYLAAAFSTIDGDTIEKIQKLYMLDFIAFGYDSQPPK